ncbi:MAG: tRNA (N6-threonylcarbamoyladenosine(37)-N6)-methyltransferase TrmO [Clostridia bacterium]|nr:tRNA (N6-threonylcarbamoyladenosine(37)-N6)-methyltransferase TrmO [Clostridia bacterium]
MDEAIFIRPIARIRGDFSSRFGIPRQSGLAPSLLSEIVFETAYRDENALRGLEGYSHIWLIWGFSESRRETWLPMVKPPRLGGNRRMGVFATRSPYRPNPLGLSCVRLEAIQKRPGLGSVLHVSGADLMDGTPIYDIKPYLAFTDSRPEARQGFAGERLTDTLEVEIADAWLERLPPGKRAGLVEALRQDPRPAYQDDPDQRYGFAYAGFDVRFRVEGRLLRVVEITEAFANGRKRHDG